MPGDHDDDALSWDGDIRDATHVEGSADAIAAPAAVDAAPVGGSVALVAYGVLAGAYLLFVVGWIAAAQRDPFTSGTLLFSVMYQLGQFLAIAAPALWFGLVLLLTPGRRAAVRLGWLLLGSLLVAPWPYILSSAATMTAAGR